MAEQIRYVVLLSRRLRPLALVALAAVGVCQYLFSSETAQEHVRRALESYRGAVALGCSSSNPAREAAIFQVRILASISDSLRRIRLMS